MTWDYSCERTGKRRYPSSEDAHEAMRKVAKRGVPQKPYRCPACSGWHLTHLLHETRAKDFHKQRTSR